jgi:hypothetical protein
MVLISVTGSVDPRGLCTAGRIRSIEKSNDLIGIRSRDLAVCSIVPQLRAPILLQYLDQRDLAMSTGFSRKA